MTSYMSRSEARYDDEGDDLDEKPRSRRLRTSKNSTDNSAESESMNGGSTGDSNRERLLSSSDEDTPSPRKPSEGKMSSKSRDTLTPLKSPDSDTHENTNEDSIFLENTMNGGDSENAMNGGDSENTMNGGDSENTMNGGDSENTKNEGDSENTMNGGDSENTMNGGDSENTMNGGDSERTINGGDSSSVKRLTKSNTVASSEAENRRESFGSNRSTSESSPRRLSQRRSIDRPEWSSSTVVEHNRVATNTLSRNASVVEEEGNEQRSAAKLRAAWESRAHTESSKSFSRAKAVGGQTGASTLKARFENPTNQTYQRRTSSTRKMSRSGSIHEADAETAKKESTSALKARFEQKNTEAVAAVAAGKRNFVINKGKAGEAAKKFNQGPSNSTKCLACQKSVYPMEKLEVEGLLYHKLCFKCETCKRTLGVGNFASLEGKYYCKPHLKQLFALKGNYDEGFGREQRKRDWVNKDDATTKSSTPGKSTQEQKFTPEPASESAKPEPTEVEQSDDSEVNGHVNGAEADEEPPVEEDKSEADEEDDVGANQSEPDAASASDDGIQNGDVSGEDSGDDY